MRIFLCVSVLSAVCLVFACSSETTIETSSSGSSGTDGTSGGTSGGSSGDNASGGTSGGTSGGSSGEAPPASTTEVDVQFTSACPAFTGCGGNPSGTYDYSAGCVGDYFEQAKTLCNSIDTSNTKVTVQGTIYFLANAALKRDVTLKVTGSLKVPAACAAAGCGAVEAALKTVMPNTTCAAAADGCDCTLNEARQKQSTTTFTVNGDTVTTADGETYTICEEGSKLKYKGASAGAEDGVWELTKR